MMGTAWNVKGFLKLLGAAACGGAMLLPELSVCDASPAENPKTFSSSKDAADALIKASETNDSRALEQLFAPNGKDLAESGDPSEDARSRAHFTEMARKKMALLADPSDPTKLFISVGDESWPFPVPLIEKDGLWMFDSSEGKREVLARFIGAHELAAIEICRGYVEAQNLYAQTHLHNGIPEYAQKLVSSARHQDGLYWEPKNGQPPSPVPADFAKAAEDMKPGERKPYHGYYFRILTAQGPDAHGGAMNYVVDGAMTAGFALLAWPADYGETGVEAMIVNQDGIVYQSNLGADSDKKAPGLTQFNPDSSWTPVKPE